MFKILLVQTNVIIMFYVQVGKDIMVAVSGVLDTNEETMKKAESMNNAASNIRTKLDQFTESLSKALTETISEIKVSTPNIAAIVLKVNKSEPFELNVASSEGDDINLQTGHEHDDSTSGPTKSMLYFR